VKSAKEMFEDLGYKHSLFGNKDNKNIIYDLVNEDTYIMFRISTKEIKFCGVFPNKVDSISFSMNTALLQAINKQVEELGWIGSDKE
jgi:hypothetical protein